MILSSSAEGRCDKHFKSDNLLYIKGVDRSGFNYAVRMQNYLTRKNTINFHIKPYNSSLYNEIIKLET